LVVIAGPIWLWERFPDERNQRVKRKGVTLRGFDPDQFILFMRHLKRDYLLAAYKVKTMAELKEKHPDAYFRLHNFRTTAMSKAFEAVIPTDKGFDGPWV
jgi:hypothetical protein